MSLADLIRSGVELAHQITLDGELQCSIPHYCWTGYSNAHGDSTYDDPVTRTGIYSQKNELINVGGQLIETKATLLFLEPFEANGADGRREPVDNRDVFDLPDGSKGLVIDVKGLTDPSTNRPYFCKVYFGSPGPR